MRLGSVTVTADGSSQKCEAQKNADLVLQTNYQEKKSHIQLSASVLALPGMRLSASTIGIIWNFENRAFRSSGSAPSMYKHLPDDLDGLLLGGGYPERCKSARRK